jgi:CHAD domain-containing protein
MASATSVRPSKERNRAGFAYWMRRVLKECDRAQHAFDIEAVHDLRVALRRCRSMARGFSEIDPDASWRRMQKAGTALFQALGNLRDNQILVEWLFKLAPQGDAVREALLEALAKKKTECQREAETAIGQFDRRQWRRWCRQLPPRARRIPLNGRVFQHLALERWLKARELHARAVRGSSRVACHRLRIGIKHFRYTVENFLPRDYLEWGRDLKHVQDQLGDAHDLDVLRAALPAAGAALTIEARAHWEAAIAGQRAARIAQYRAKMTPNAALFRLWRAALPSGRRLESAAIAKFAAWARFLDPDALHARHVAALALQLFDGLACAGLHEVFRDTRARQILRGAALLHEVGRSKKEAGHHKTSYRLIRDIAPPIGWTADQVKRMALVARYHRGAEPRARHEGFADLSPSEQQGVVWLAALLRFADSFDLGHNRRVVRLDVQAARDAIVVRAHGYVHDLLSAAQVAERKHLLESLCGRPIMVRSDAMELTAPALEPRATPLVPARARA